MRALGLFWDDEPKRRIAPKLLRKLVWERDKGICKLCGKEADQWNWELGHDRAHSRGGRMTLGNTFVVHSFCNRSQSTRSVREMRKALGISSPHDAIKKQLKSLTLPQLKYLAKSHKVKPKRRVEEGLLSDYVVAPSKQKYINALAKVVTESEVSSAANYRPEAKKRRRRRESSWW
jgi:hypothetical protein